ncbi:hypothetical protein [Algoriphagus hitonicola]|uniref:Uncharacterized protein n=1 Tax=Algoriphagus hitonicola TaxID=435880 RepID=A0A1I2XKA5_9BACT|nr:hypothetical protein [Algoriphagus hitonicola]SFH13517.1 hypothetical protein SAMN04487988_11939 [Algoriphagus hitonicola]
MKTPAVKFIHSDSERKLMVIDFQKAYHRAFEESVKQWEKSETHPVKKIKISE